VLFKFHIDERVQQEFPEWAADLYDNPPIPDEDKLLPELSDVMNANAFYHLRPKIKTAMDATVVQHMSLEDVHAVLARTDGDILLPAEETPDAAAAAAAAAEADASFDLSSADFMSARGLESIVALASSQLMFASPAAPHSHPHMPAPVTPLAAQHTHPLLPLNIDVAAPSASPTASGVPGPSAGSSVRARRQAKRMMSEVPGGAATPVPRKRRREEDDGEIDLAGDTSFLDAL
jgi:hypothetical protein